MIRIVFLSLIFVFACESLNSPGIIIISESDFIELHDSDYTLIDVRTQDEFDLGHIDSAINLDFYSESFQNDILSLPKNETIVLYCRTGVRSANSCALMKELGFKKTYNLVGGIVEWKGKLIK